MNKEDIMSGKKFDDLYEVGRLIDEFEIRLIEKDFDVKKVELSLVSKIEDRLGSFDLDKMENDQLIIYHYSNSNYKAILKKISFRGFEFLKKYSKIVEPYEKVEDFVFENYLERIQEYRKAISLINKDTKLSDIYLSQIFVNIANLYLEMGRVVESIQELIDGNNVVEGFLMAKANLAMKHYSLSIRTTDESVVKFLMEKGLVEIGKVIEESKSEYIPVDILENFCKWESFFEKYIIENLSDVKAWNKSKDVDYRYKEWSAKRKLTLNYINVIYPFGNIDDVNMPNMGIGYWTRDTNMEYYAWFNTIKQEYNMARYYLYQIDNMEYNSDVHESQRNNILIDTLDYPAMGYKTELLKASMKTAFSVLDKIGLFCCHFHNQNIPVHKVDFHKWYKEIELKIALKSPFNALYWLSQDFDMNVGKMKEIRLLRNFLEHRYIRVIDSCNKNISQELSDKNKYEYIISYKDLEEKAYQTLKIVRSAIFYMASGFNIEFNRVYYNTDKIFIPLNIYEYDDEWKN